MSTTTELAQNVTKMVDLLVTPMDQDHGKICESRHPRLRFHCWNSPSESPVFGIAHLREWEKGRLSKENGMLDGSGRS
ncbi:hypothetical protein V6N11_013238 [Hibiscus sabdariffa]|uniref:Uncharacterized protein n=2 Tax=Hibiscus sabdariffa TaxID=183260 RepID=A0ABR2B991_9ROSI